MKTYIIDNGSQFTSNLELLCQKLEPEVVPYKAVAQTAIEDDSLLILSGGSGKPIKYYPEEYSDELSLIHNHKGPILGICFGFELVAYAFGAELELSEERHQGIVNIVPIGSSPDLFPENETLSVYESHRWVVKKVMEPLIPLASSDDGIEIIKHRDKPMYGFQFHPESPNDIHGRQLLLTVLDQLTMQPVF